MHEDVRRPVLRGDEAEALDDVEPLARALLADPATCNSHGSSEGETQCQRVQGLSLTLAYIVIDHCSVQPATYEVIGGCNPRRSGVDPHRRYPRRYYYVGSPSVRQTTGLSGHSSEGAE